MIGFQINLLYIFQVRGKCCDPEKLFIRIIHSGDQGTAENCFPSGGIQFPQIVKDSIGRYARQFLMILQISISGG